MPWTVGGLLRLGDGEDSVGLDRLEEVPMSLMRLTMELHKQQANAPERVEAWATVRRSLGAAGPQR